MDLWSAWNLFLFIIGFGSLIFVHELGHFLVAKWVGVKVTQFAIGFGHAVLCYRKGIGYRVGTTEPAYRQRIEQFVRERRRQRGGGEEDPDAEDGGEITAKEVEEAERELGLGETEYRLNWMPFGGYVKMVGQEDLDPRATSDDPRSFNNKPIWARLCVVSAGVVMNVIFAVLFFMVAFMIGVSFPPAIIGNVEPGSPAAQAAAVDDPDVVGLKPGDRVVRINGEETTDFVDVRIASALARRDQTLHIDVRRPQLGEESAEELSFAITPVEDPDDRLLHIGVAPAFDLQLAQGPGVEALLEAYDLEGGMRITAVNGQPVDEHWQYRRLLNEAGGEPVELTVERPARRGEEPEQRTVTFEPETDYMRTEQGQAHVLGLMPATRIIQVAPGTPAEGVLQSGDLIAAIEDTPWPGPTELSQAVERAEGEAVTVTVEREGSAERVEITPRNGQLGVVLDLAPSVIRGVVSGSAAASLDLPAGTRLVEVDGEPAETLSDLRVAIQQSEADQRTFEVAYRLPVGDVVETQELTVSAEQRAALAELEWVDNLPFTVLQVPQQASGPVAAIGLGVQKTNSFMIQTYITINRLFNQTVHVEHLRGPVGIVAEGTRFAERGIGYLLFFLGLISINLAVINFLPLPIVDGGLALLLLWEKVRGKPAPPEVQSALTVIGLLLIGALFVTVTYHDISRLFG